MRVVKAIMILAVIWMIIVFTEQNSGSRYILTVFGKDMGDSSVIESLLAAFLLGIVVAGTYSLQKYNQLSKKYKRCLSEIAKLERDLRNIRKMTIEEHAETEEKNKKR